MKIQRNLIINKRNGQASITIPSKVMKKLEQTPKKVLIDFSNLGCSKRLRTKIDG